MSCSGGTSSGMLELRTVASEDEDWMVAVSDDMMDSESVAGDSAVADSVVELECCVTLPSLKLWSLLNILDAHVVLVLVIFVVLVLGCIDVMTCHISVVWVVSVSEDTTILLPGDPGLNGTDLMSII